MFLHTERPNTCLTNVVKYCENTIRRSDIKPLTKCDETLPMHVQVFLTLHMSQNWSSTPHLRLSTTVSTLQHPVPDATDTGTRHYHGRPIRWHTHILPHTGPCLSRGCVSRKTGWACGCLLSPALPKPDTFRLYRFVEDAVCVLPMPAALCEMKQSNKVDPYLLRGIWQVPDKHWDTCRVPKGALIQNTQMYSKCPLTLGNWLHVTAAFCIFTIIH